VASRCALALGSLERPAVFVDAKTGAETLTVWDHGHCEICHQCFSARYQDDLRENWAMPGPAGLLEPEWQPDYQGGDDRSHSSQQRRLGSGRLRRQPGRCLARPSNHRCELRHVAVAQSSISYIASHVLRNYRTSSCSSVVARWSKRRQRNFSGA
jgi:hypothetical protein